MIAVTHPTARRGFFVACSLYVFFAAGTVAAQKAPLFPEPLHLSRTVEDPLMNEPVTIEEYYFGNRVVSLLGQKVVIADYDRGEMTEVDRAAGTYSITTFEQLASLNAAATQQKAAAVTDDQFTFKSATRRNDSRASETFEATPNKPHGNLKKLEVGVDHTVKLSRDAIEVLVGAAYPRSRSVETDFFIRGASPSPGGGARTQAAGTRAAAEYSLPVDQIVSFDMDGRELVTRNRIVRVVREAPPADAITIPPGARQVESNAVTAARTIQDLEQKPAKSKQ